MENCESQNRHHFILIYNPINSQEVAIIRMILEREQIPYVIKNDPLHKAALFSINGPGEIQLYVAPAFAENTINLLKEELGHD